MMMDIMDNAVLNGSILDSEDTREINPDQIHDLSAKYKTMMHSPTSEDSF